MKNAKIIDLQPYLEEVDAIKVCPRANGSMVPCIAIHCVKHAIRIILSEKELNIRPQDKIVETLVLLRETCSVDLLSNEKPIHAHSEEEIADSLGISKKRVRQIIEKAQRKLRSSGLVKKLIGELNTSNREMWEHILVNKR